MVMSICVFVMFYILRGMWEEASSYDQVELCKIRLQQQFFSLRRDSLIQ